MVWYLLSFIANKIIIDGKKLNPLSLTSVKGIMIFLRGINFAVQFIYYSLFFFE